MPLDCQTPVTNLIGLSIKPTLSKKIIYRTILRFSKKVKDIERRTDAAVIILGMYITTLKKPFPGILSFASVNQTASKKRNNNLRDKVTNPDNKCIT